MKEALIAFIIALIIGSLLNGLQQSSVNNENAPNGAPAPTADSSLKADSVQVALGKVASVKEDGFEKEVIENNKPVLVDFYTQNCPHCRHMSPLIDELAHDYVDKLKVVKMDVMHTPAIAQQYDVGPVPTFILFSHGKPAQKVVGELSKNQLVALVKSHLDNN